MTLMPATVISQTDKVILIVEDEQIIRELLCEVLEMEGFVTQGEENADAALEFLNQHPTTVGLLLTDVNMPGTMNGAALARMSTKAWPSIPVIVMSGLESPASCGVSKDILFIRKPFTIAEVLHCIRAAFPQGD